MKRRSATRLLVVAGVLVALLLAGVVSFYASGDPDGLTKVSEDQGFAEHREGAPAGDGPLAGYETKGVADGRLSGGVAGVLGSLVVLALAGGGALVVRRRRTRPTDGADRGRPARPQAALPRPLAGSTGRRRT